MERDDTLVGHRWVEPPRPLVADKPDSEPIVVPQPPLLDPDTAKAIRALCWTLCWLLWLISAIVLLFLVMVAVAVVNGSLLPG